MATATVKGPAIVLARIPTRDGRLFELERASDSAGYCDELKRVAADGANRRTLGIEEAS